MTAPDFDPNAQGDRPEPLVEKRVPVAPEAEAASTAGLYEAPPEPDMPQAAPPAPEAGLEVATPPHIEPPTEAPDAPAGLAQPHDEPLAPAVALDAPPPPQTEPTLAPELQESLPVSIQERMASLLAENERLRTEIDALAKALQKALN